MTNYPCTNIRLNVPVYNNSEPPQSTIHELNVTARHLGDNVGSDVYQALIVRTVKLWVYLAGRIQAGAAEVLDTIAYKSVETAVEDLQEFVGLTFEHRDETRVTVFDWSHKINLTVHSNTLPQPALDLWWATENAVGELKKIYQNIPQARQEGESGDFAPLVEDKPATPKNAPPAPNTAPAPTEGLLTATRAPSKARQYADGQLVVFSINKIVMGTNKGSVTYALWGALGVKYPLKSIYKTKQGSDENSSDYIAAKDVLAGLGLSVDAGKIETAGNWQLVCRVAHGKNGKGEETEFFNVVSLTAI